MFVCVSLWLHRLQVLDHRDPVAFRIVVDFIYGAPYETEAASVYLQEVLGDGGVGNILGPEAVAFIFD